MLHDFKTLKYSTALKMEAADSSCNVGKSQSVYVTSVVTTVRNWDLAPLTPNFTFFRFFLREAIRHSQILLVFDLLVQSSPQIK
jgi:hypothetical protein